MRVGILGSGFGLYCYLPAILIGCRQNVLLPDRYRERLRLRADVGSLVEYVEWAESEEAMLGRADTLVISQRPADQIERVADCLRRGNIVRLMLEKPVAADPISALRLLDQINRSDKRVCVGYIFRYTTWGKALLSHVRDALGTIEIRWHFRAHHYNIGIANWKRQISSGGGAIRFFGIHLIALLAEIGYCRVVSSYTSAQAKDEAETWRAVLAGDGLPDCHIDLDTNHDENKFKVTGDCATPYRSLDFNLSEPLETTVAPGRFDHRVVTLTKLCEDFFRGQGASANSYGRSILLWRDIEAATTMQPLHADSRTSDD